MNLKKLFLMLTFFVLLGTTAFAQTTVYVDNTPGVGNDFNNGLTASTPKATIGSALAAFPSGTTIKVKGTGLLYNETVTLGAGVNEKEYIIGTYDATAPTITGLLVNLTAVAGPTYLNEVTFTGPFVVNSGLTLTAGDVLGAGNLTVKTAVTVTEGTVDAALVYSGNVNVTYNGANNRTTGGELGSASTIPQNLTLALTVAKTLTLNASRTFSGTFTSNANSTFALGSNTLTLTASAAHANTGAITASSTGGVVVDGTNGAMSFGNAGALPNVTIQNGGTLTISATTSIGSLTANSASSITLSTGGAVTIDNTKGTGKVTNTSSGIISYTGGGTLLIKKDVEQSGVATASNKAQISFAGGVVTINGNVINSAALSISTTSTAVVNVSNILFNAGAHIINGSVKLTGSGSVTTTTAVLANLKTVEFAAVAQLTRIDGGISNECSLTLSKSTGAITKSGSVLFTGRTSGAVGVGAAGQRVAISNTSSIITNTFDPAAQQNGAVDLDAVASLTTGAFIGTNVTTSGGSGGYINLGAGNAGGATITLTGDMINSRTDADGDIVLGGVTTGAVSIGGKLENSGAADIIVNTTGAVGFTVTGATNISGGTVTFTAAAYTGAVAFTGGFSLTGGKLDISATGVTAISSGSLTLTGGTLAVGTAAVRTWSSNAISHTIGGATANTTITPNTYLNTTTFTFTTPAFAQVQTVTFGPAVPVIPGGLTVNNGTALPVPVVFTGGNVRVLNNVTFTAGVVQLNGTKLIVGQSLGTPLGNGTFTNTAGYTSINMGAVSMNGGINPATLAAATQGIAANGGATYQYGDFEIDTNPGVLSAVTPAVLITLQGNLYLTRGQLDNSINNATFNNSTVVPTIVRNAGLLTAAPAYGAGTTVNISYIGTDKTASFEMESGVSGVLNNLTVATTDGALAGSGTVNITGAILTGGGAVPVTVSGVLTINAGQALLLNGIDLVVAGASFVNNGILANVGAGDELQFGATTGTTVTGSGWLPNVQVLGGTAGNIINGAKGLVTTFLGADNLQGGVGGAADFVPATTEVTGSLIFANGTADLKVMFGAGALNGTNLLNLTTANAGNTLTISANLTQAGNVAHTAGTIQIDDTFTWKHRGTAPAFTGGALTTGLGTLTFTGNAATPVVFSAVATDVTIAAKVQVNLANTADVFQLNNATAGHLIVSNDFTVTKGVVQLGTAGVARNLTLTGSKLTLTSTGSFNTTGIGTLRLNAATPPLTWAFSGAVTMGNVRVSKDVTLSGSSSPSLTVNGLFTHDGGLFTFGDMNLTVAGGFTRTANAGGYSAGTGYLIVRNAAFNQGTGFSIPNLRFGVADALNIAFGGTGNVTVTKKLYVDNANTNTITHTGTLYVSDAADIYYSDGKFDVAPVYGATANLHVVNTAGAARVIHATVWPAVTGFVQQLEINNPGFGAVLPGARTVNKEILLTAGTLDLSAATQVLTLVDASTINVLAGTFTASAGSVVYGNANNVNYKNNAAYAGVANAVELPSTVNNLTFTRNTNSGNSAVTINKSVTINGTLTIKNNVTIAAAPPIVVTVNGDVTIANDVANFALAANPVTTFNQSMVFGGGNTTFTVPNLTPALNVGAITINKTANTNTLTLVGGNLATGTITFTKGNIITGSNILFIPAPTTTAVAGGAQSQGFSGASAASMVVGNVGKTLINTGAIGGATPSTEATSIFPVGTGVVYRPASLTFNPAFGVPTTPNATIVVSHVNSNPGGSSGLPIKDGVATGINVSRYPAFYWNLYTVGSVGQSTVFDLGLTAGNFTDFDAPANVRIIRRHGAVVDVNNEWLLQGLNTGYDNEVNSTTGFTAINRNSVGGLRTGGAVFTLGVKSNITLKSANPLGLINGKIWLVVPQGAKLLTLTNTFQGNIGTLSFTAQSSNPAVATAEIIGTSVKLTPLTIGEAVITVTAIDAANNDFFAYSFGVDSRLTDVESEEAIPTEFALMQNFPNPFNPTTNIKFALPTESNVSLKIYNILGEEVAALINKVMPAGFHTYNFDATRLSSGMYIYRIEAGSFVQVKKMLLMK